MTEVLRQTALVAPSDTRVLITGESGAGKEIVADIIHAWSHRAQGSLVKINCAAVPETASGERTLRSQERIFYRCHR